MHDVSILPTTFFLKRRPNTYGTASSVATGVSGTFVDLHLTAGPSEARSAGTGVASLTRVATSGSIHAGPVVGAVVEIWRDTCGLATAQHMAEQQQQQQQRQNVFCPPAHLTLSLLPVVFCFLLSPPCCSCCSHRDNCCSVVVSAPQW